MDAEIARLDRLLNQIQLLGPPYVTSSKGKDLFQEICKLVLQDRIYTRLWFERTLNQLNELFQEQRPDEELFGRELREIHQRMIEVSEVNDLFFGVLDASTSEQDLCVSLSKLQPLAQDFVNQIDTSGRLSEIRNQNLSCSARIALFLEFLKDDLGFDLTQRESVKGVLVSLKGSEAVGNVNALLVKADGKGLLVPLHIKIQAGSGEVECRVKGSEGFRQAVERAQSAMKDSGYISSSEDVLYTLDFTEMEYQGASIALAAAVGMYAVKRNVAIDPYTAFTGEINLDDQNWVIQPVNNIHEKIAAAERAGCRRVFVPLQNHQEVKDAAPIKVHGVESLIDVFIQLQPSHEFRPGDSLQGRKISAIQKHCAVQGWDLDPFEPIQAGLQSTVVPLEINPVKIQIYNSGAHTPKKSLRVEYDSLFSTLNSLDHLDIPIRAINESLNVKNPELQARIQTSLEKLSPSQSLSEQYCIYSFKFVRENEKLAIKQFSSGKLTLQGAAGPLYKSVLENIVPLYNIYFPTSKVSAEYFLAKGNDKAAGQETLAPNKLLAEVPLPHIGTDESGKGDYFGSMVIAGVFLDSVAQTALSKLGVKDSKLLTDKRCSELAAEIRHLIPGKHQEVEIPPERYNRLYDDFKLEGKNLNHLLAWGHARAIEDILQKRKCSYAIADQFGDEHYIQSKLMEKGRRLELIQLPKGERYLAVAAASILARDKFLARLENLRTVYGIDFPKGASNTVVDAAKAFVQKHGVEQLRKIAKLHHKTTDKIKEE